MGEKRAYLDCNATAPLRPEARTAMLAAFEAAGNASAVHHEGRQARKLIEEARAAVAALVSARAEDVFFTSGGSEGAATLLAPGFKGPNGQPVTRLIVSAIEHSAVLSGGRFDPACVDICPVTADGVIDLAALRDLLARTDEPALVALMLANNETGIIQPVHEAVALARSFGASIICDAVQAIGKIEVDLKALGVDALFLSGHKLGAPQGVGAVVLAEGASLGAPLIRGGTQEGRKRAGTENVAAIAALGAVCLLLKDKGVAESQRFLALRERLETELSRLHPDIVIVGKDMPRLPNTSLVIADGIVGETAVIALDLASVAIATGSACASGKVTPNHVLKAMGVSPELARAALRISIGWSTSDADIDCFIKAFSTHRQRVAERVRAA